jgi:hypothetical protein
VSKIARIQLGSSAKGRIFVDSLTRPLGFHIIDRIHQKITPCARYERDSIAYRQTARLGIEYELLDAKLNSFGLRMVDGTKARLDWS